MGGGEEAPTSAQRLRGGDMRRRRVGDLKRERLAHRVRMQSLLVTQGLKLKIKRALGLRLDGLTLWDGRALPGELKAELERERERLALVERQMQELEAQRRERLMSPRTEAEQRIVQLMRLGAIGPASAWLLVMEFFGWRAFRNRRELAALAGLVGTPYNSGESERDQGISKAGNRRVRAMIVEIAWLWLRFQPKSALSQWYRQALRRRGLAHAPHRHRRIGEEAADRAVALPRGRRDPRRRATHRLGDLTP